MKELRFERLRQGSVKLDSKEYACELTEKLDKFLIHKTYPGYRFYFTGEFDGWYSIRVPGATRGGIKVDKETNIIVQVELNKELLATDRFRDMTDSGFEEALKIMKSYIGYKVVLPNYTDLAKGIKRPIQVYTCYYANTKNMTEEDKKKYTLVSISNTNPSWFREKLKHLKKYSPSYLVRELIKAHNPKGKELYAQELERTVITDEFEENTVFLCHEADDTYCHRSVFRERLNKEGYKCDEIYFPRK